jgi:hypothetical protein
MLECNILELIRIAIILVKYAKENSPGPNYSQTNSKHSCHSLSFFEGMSRDASRIVPVLQGEISRLLTGKFALRRA